VNKVHKAGAATCRPVAFALGAAYLCAHYRLLTIESTLLGADSLLNTSANKYLLAYSRRGQS